MNTVIPEKQKPTVVSSRLLWEVTAEFAALMLEALYTPQLPIINTRRLRRKLGFAGVLRVPDRNSRDDARHGFNLDDKTNPALTVPLVNWPVKPATAVPTHRTDSMLRDQREE